MWFLRGDASLSAGFAVPPRIMKSNAAPRLPRMAMNAAMTRYFMRQIIGFFLTGMGARA
jgi:hypothetical protein